MSAYGHLTRSILTRTRVQARDCVKIECFDYMLRQERLPYIKGSLNN